MEYGEALGLIERGSVTSENASEVLSAVKRNVADILAGRNRANTRLNEIESTLASVIASAGATGEGLEDRIKSLSSKITELKSEVDTTKQTLSRVETEKGQLEATKAELEAKTKNFERTEHTRTLAAKAGASPEVFAMLTKGYDLEKLTVEGDEVKIDGKPFKDWVELPEVKPFVPALIQQQAPSPPPRLPGAPPANSQNQPDPTATLHQRATGRDPSKMDWLSKKK